MSVGARMTVSGADELRARFDALKNEVKGRTFTEAMTGGAEYMARQMERAAPVEDGILRRSIFGKMLTASDLNGVKVEGAGKIRGSGVFIRRGRGEAWYWKFIEFGVQPHRIKVKDAKALNVEGKPARTVNHPGFRAKPFIRPTFDRAKVATVEVIRKTFAAGIAAAWSRK